MSVVEMKSLLEAGVHFGHQTHRWNPKMEKYIFVKRNGIHIIDLGQTLEAINQAYYFLRELAAKGNRILFVGTKKQVSEEIESAAKKCNEFYVSHRWFGGILTNLKTIRKSIDKLEHFENLRASGEIEKYTKLEVLKMQRKYDKILNALGGIRDMDNLPSAIVIADTVNEKNALREAQKLGVPIVAIVDTNSNPDGIDFVIPGNDDAMKSVNLICDIMANAINEGKKIAAEGGDIEEILKESKEVEKVSQKEKVEEIIEEEKTSEEKKEKLVIEDSKKKTKKEKTVKVKKKFICEYCDKEFTSRRGLKIHLGLVHQK